jgi:hypothetical protein
MCFGALPNSLIGPSLNSGPLSEFDGVREPQLYIESGVWYLLYDAADHVHGWQQYMAKSVDRGQNWTRLGPVSMEYSNGEAGTYAATATGWLEKRGATYYMHRVTAKEAQPLGTLTGLPSIPYGWDVWSASSPTGPWTWVRKVPFPGSGWAHEECLAGSVLLSGGTYYAYVEGRATGKAGGEVEVGYATASSPGGVWTVNATQLLTVAKMTPRFPENPKGFYHTGLERFVLLCNMINAARNGTDENVVLTATTPTGFAASPIHYVQSLDAIDDSERGVGVLCYATAPEGAAVEDSGYVPAVFDTAPTRVGPSEWHLGRSIYGAVLEPSATALRVATAEATNQNLSRPLAHTETVEEFCLRMKSGVGSSVEFRYRQTGTGNTSNCYRVVLRSGETPQLRKYEGGVKTIATGTGATVHNDGQTWDRVRIEALGSTHRVWLNGTLVIEATDTAYAEGDHVSLSALKAEADIRLLSVYEENFVTVGGLPPGVQITLRTWGDLPVNSVIADETGVAKFIVIHGPYKSFEAGGESYSPAGGIWGGDSYTLEGVPAPEEGTVFPMGEISEHEETRIELPSSSYITRLRERAPLRLNIDVQTPDGRHARWGADDPEPENAPVGLSFSTVMPGGFERMSCTLERDSRKFYPDTAELSTLTIYGPGGQVAWQGRLEKIPDTGGYQQQEQPEAVGWQAHLEDNNAAREIYVDRELSRWEGPTTRRQIALVSGSFTPEVPQLAANPAGSSSLTEQFTGPWLATSKPMVEAWYDAKGIPLGNIRYSWERGTNVNNADTKWNWNVQASSDDILTAVDASGNLRAAGPGLLQEQNASLGRFWALLQLTYEAEGGADNTAYALYWPFLAVYGRHGLEVHEPGIYGLFAADVVAHAVGKWAPKLAFTTGPEGTIRPSSFIIPQLTFLEPTTVAEIIKQATRFELLDWAVWEGPTYYQNERGARGKQWRARVGPAQLQEAGPQVSRLWNGVVVTYTDVTGIVRTVGPVGSGMNTESVALEDNDPEDPLNQAGIKRWAPLKMGTSTAAGAEKVGATFLRESAGLETSGQATLVAHVEDSSGVLWPAWMVRAGDSISFVDAAITAPRRIVHSDYSDDTKSCTVALDQPPDGLTQILERLSVVLLPLGVSG